MMSSLGTLQPRLKKDPGRTRTTGAQFEYKLAGVAFLRARKTPGLRFLLSTNVQGLNPMDDIFFRLHWKENGQTKSVTYFVQLKHAEKDKKVKYDTLKNEEGDFSITKYFKFYKNLKTHIEKMKYQHQPKRQDQVLYDCNIEDCRFIIYTNRSMSGLPNIMNNQTKFPEFPFSELLLTSDAHHIISLNDPTLANLVDTNDHDLFLKDFLPRFKVFTKQAHADQQMSDMLVTNLDQLFGSPITPALHVSKFSEFLHKWWERDETQCLTETSYEIEVMLKDSVNFIANEEFNEINLFTDPKFKKLEDKGSSKKILLLSVPGVSMKLRTKKVLQILHRDFENNYLFVNEKVITQFPLKALMSISNNICNVVLVDCDELSKNISVFLKNIIILDKCKLILVSKSYNSQLTSFLKSCNAQYDEIVDYWALEQITYEKQEELLARNVLFQGREMELRKLEAQWPSLRKSLDGSFIRDLISNHKVKIGEALSSNEDIYLPRTLQHASTIHHDVLQLQKDTEILALSGFSEIQIKSLMTKDDATNVCAPLKVESNLLHTFDGEDIPNLSGKNTNRDYYRQNTYVDQQSFSCSTVTADQILQDKFINNFTVSKSTNLNGEYENIFLVPLSFSSEERGESIDNHENKFKELCTKQKEKNIHWIHQQNGVLVWKKSYGKTEKLIPFLDKKHDNCQPNTICIHQESNTNFSSWKEKVNLLIGEPGIGKSQFLLNIAKCLNREKQEYWTVFIPINYHRTFMGSLPPTHEINKQHILDLLSEAVNITGVNDAVSRNFLEESLDAGKVLVLVDGIDEVCPSYQEKTLDILKQLIQCNVSQLWVTSRGHVQDELQKSLASVPLALNPFTESEQVQYLVSSWNKNLENIDQNRLVHMVKQLVHDLKEKTASSGRSISDIPLYSHLIAITCENEIRESIENDQSFLQSWKINLLKLYKKFVHYTRRRYNKHYGVSGPQYEDPAYIEREEGIFNEIHMKCAIIALFLEENTGIPIQQFDNDVKETTMNSQIQKTGIMKIVRDEGKPEFIHRSFAEYFAALWMKDNYRSYRTFLTDYFSSRTEGMARVFFDLMLAEGHELHEAALGGRAEEVRALLEMGCDANAADAGGRSALHLAAIHGRAEAAAALLDAGSRVGAEDCVLVWTPLRYADASLHLDVAELLLARGSDPSHLVNIMIHAQTDILLIKATSKGYQQIARFLHQKHVINVTASGGLKPIHIAVFRGHTDVVRMFLDEGVPWDERQVNGRTTLHDSVQEGHEEIVDLLLSRGADPNVRDFAGITPMFLAFAKSYTEIARKLKDHGARVDVADDDGRTALHFVVHCSKEMVKLLLSWGAQPNARDNRGITPLMLSGGVDKDVLLMMVDYGGDLETKDSKGRTVMHFAAQSGNKQIMQYLLDVDLDPNSSGDFTPLHVAVWNGHVDILDMLLKCGAKWNLAQRNNGRTALHDAAQEGYLQIVQTLIDLGAEVDVEDNQKVTPLTLSVWNGHVEVTKYFLEKGSTCKQKLHESRSLLHLAMFKVKLEIIKVLLDAGCDVNAVDNEAATPLHYAAMLSDLEVFKLLLEKGAQNSAKTNAGRNTLHFACVEGKSKIVSYLVENGSDPNARDDKMETPLFVATVKGNIDTVNILLKKGADWNLKGCRDRTVLHCAAQNGHLQLVEKYHDLGVNPDEPDRGDAKPLHYAAANGHFEIVKTLLSWECCPDSQDSDGKTPLHLAAREGHVPIVQILLPVTNVDHRFKNGVQPIHEAAFRGHYHVVHLLSLAGLDIDCQDDNGNTALLNAVLSNHPHTVLTLLSFGAEVNKANVDKRTPLQIAAAGNHRDILNALMRKGANVNACDKYGRTPLHEAVTNDNTSIVEQLLDAGAEVNVLDSKGFTPFLGAAACGSLNVLELLAGRNGRIHTTLPSGRSALHLVAETNNLGLASALLRMGLQVNSADICGITPLFIASDQPQMLQLLLNQGAKWQVRCINGRTPLHYAAQTGCLATAILLVKLGIPVDSVDKKGVTSMILAAELGHVEMMKFLGEHGASWSRQQNNGRSPLHQASQRGCEKAVRLLLENGADYNVKDVKDITPLHVASANGYDSVVELLLFYGAKSLPDIKGLLPIFAACNHGHFQIAQRLLDTSCASGVSSTSMENSILTHAAAHSGSFDTFEMLLARGFPWNTVTESGSSILHAAVLGKNPTMVKHVLQLGTDPNLLDKNDMTPTLLAAGVGDETVLRVLLEAGGRVVRPHSARESALTISCKRGTLTPQLLKLLLEYGADPNDTSEKSVAVLHIAAHNGQEEITRALLDWGADCRAVDQDTGSTPLHRAALNGNVAIVQMLVDALVAKAALRSALDATDNERKTPLHIAAGTGHAQVVQLLLMQGAKCDARDAQRLTPLHLAAIAGDLKTVTALLDAGANPEAKSKQGPTPLTIAASRGHKQVVQALLQAAALPRASEKDDNEEAQESKEEEIVNLTPRLLPFSNFHPEEALNSIQVTVDPAGTLSIPYELVGDRMAEFLQMLQNFVAAHEEDEEYFTAEED